MKNLTVLLLTSLAVFSCGKDEIVSPDDTTQTVTLDCVDANCEELLVSGDPYQNNPDFFGYADPSIRKDPHSNTIWLAYSFPHYKIELF